MHSSALNFTSLNITMAVSNSSVSSDWTYNTGDMANASHLENTNATTNGTPTGTQLETEQCRLFRFMLYTIVCGLLCILGFIGNTFSFLVLEKDKSAPVASFLLQVMAVADNLFLLLWFVHYSIKDIFRYFAIDANNHPVWIYIRVYTFPFLYMTQMETIWLTVVVAMNRFMAVCLPYRAPSLCTIYNVYKEVIVVTIFSILYNVPRFLELAATTNENSTIWYRTSIGHDPIFQMLYIDAMYYLFTFVLPLLVLGFVNTRVIIAYRATQKRKRKMTSRRAENENNITLVMIMVVAIFMLCQAPARLVQLIWSYRYNHCEEYQYYLIHISNFLEVLNSSINFLIYFSFRKRFRDILGEYYCRYGPLKRKEEWRKSLTTEALALSEYQPTCSVKSNKKGTSSRYIDDETKCAALHDNDVNDTLAPTLDKTTQVERFTNGSATGQRKIENEKLTNGFNLDCEDQQSPMVEPEQETPALVEEESGQQTIDAKQSQQQPLQAELIEYELSSENPVSRASSPDDGVLHDGQMLIAKV